MNKFVMTAFLVLAAASQADAQVATQGGSSTVSLSGIGLVSIVRSSISTMIIAT